MADSYLERVAGEIADLAIADENASGDIRIVDEIAKVLGSSSQTLEEAFLTAVRVRKAEARARALLDRRRGEGYTTAIKSEGDEVADPDTVEKPREAALPPPDAPSDSDEHLSDAEKAAKEDALEKLKRSGIGMPRRVQR